MEGEGGTMEKNKMSGKKIKKKKEKDKKVKRGSKRIIEHMPLEHWKR